MNLVVNETVGSVRATDFADNLLQGRFHSAIEADRAVSILPAVKYCAGAVVSVIESAASSDYRLVFLAASVAGAFAFTIVLGKEADKPNKSPLRYVVACTGIAISMYCANAAIPHVMRALLK